MLAQLLMDCTRDRMGAVRDAAVRVFFSRTAVLRDLCDKYPWLVAMIVCVVQNKILPDKERIQKMHSDLESVKKKGFLPTLILHQASPARAKRDNMLIPLTFVTEADAIKWGRAFALKLLSSTSPEFAVDEWIVERRALVELDKHEAVFRPFVGCIATNVLKRMPLGAQTRIVFGAVVSVLDMISDIVMVFEFSKEGEDASAIATVVFIAICMILQAMAVFVANSKRPRFVLVREVLILMSCTKPAFDALRVISDFTNGVCRDENAVMTAEMEMTCGKVIELAFEAVPGTVLQWRCFSCHPK